MLPSWVIPVTIVVHEGMLRAGYMGCTYLAITPSRSNLLKVGTVEGSSLVA